MPIGKSHSSESREIEEKKSSNPNGFELSDPKYSFDDLILSADTQQELHSVIALKTEFDYVYETLGFSKTHKKEKRFIVNFYGEPGTGKTMAAHAMANAFRKKIMVIDYSQIESKYVGDTPKNIKSVFSFAKENGCLIFFDEADAILSRRVTNMDNATDTSVNQTRSVMLNILNDFDGDIIFATNFINNYDSAFMRRIVKHINFRLPDLDARVRIIRKYLPESIAEYINIEDLSHRTVGLSAAEISNAILMAAFRVASDGRRSYTQDDIEFQVRLLRDGKSANSSGLDNISLFNSIHSLSDRDVPEDCVQGPLRSRER